MPKFDIAMNNAFYAKISNFGIDTQIWHCIGDAFSYYHLISRRLIGSDKLNIIWDQRVMTT